MALAPAYHGSTRRQHPSPDQRPDPDVLLADEGLQSQVRGLMAETIAAAGALGHAIPDSFIDFQIERTYPMGPYKPSSLIDWEAGRPVEVEAIWGEPLRQGRAAGAEMPRLSLLYALLKRVAKS